MNRRDFFASSILIAGMPLTAAAKYDVVIKGGRVLDASQKLNGVMDVAVRSGKISAVLPNIAPADAAQVFNASGKLVLPGLVDIHAHVRPGELSPEQVLSRGVTTVVNAGSRGANGIQDMIDVAHKAPNRMRMMINISRLGNQADGELLNFANADVDAARSAIRAHRDVIVGVKARLTESYAGVHDLDAVRRSVQVAGSFNIPVMLHIGQSHASMPEILALLRPRDIVTHMYSPPPNGILDANGRLLPQVREARQRGVLFDVGNGRNGHITWDVVERALQQDFLPDSISSDLNGPGLTDQVFDFPNVLSKFLLLGLSLEQVISRATQNSAKAFPALKELGTLRPGVTADITILELREGQFEFVDNVGGKRTGRQKLFPHAAFVAGKLWAQTAN